MSLDARQQGDTVEIVLADDLRHPAFSWPITHMQCRVDFDLPRAPVEAFGLVDIAAGMAVPFQLSGEELADGRLKRARVHFLSDLPSGGRRVFRLVAGERCGSPAGLPGYGVRGGQFVRADRKGDTVVLDNGLVRVELPGCGRHSDSPRMPENVPAPVLRIGDSRRWLGRGVFSVPGRVTRYEVEALAVGPIFAQYRVAYGFSEGGEYVATVRLSAAMEFVEIDEEMRGFPHESPACWRLVWDGVKLEHRYCPNRPDGPIDRAGRGFENFAWEPINERLGPRGELPMKIAAYHNWLTWWRLPTAAFWSEAEDRTVGAFITDSARWDDGLYALGGTKDVLCVHFYYGEQGLSWRLPLRSGWRCIRTARTWHT